MNRCAHCNKAAAFRVASNAFQGANKLVCRSNVCWGFVTGSYGAAGFAL